MPNQTKRGPRARRASPTQSHSGTQARAGRKRRAEFVALSAKASCGPGKKNLRWTVFFVACVLALILVPPENAVEAAEPAPGDVFWYHNAPTAHQDPQRSSAIGIPVHESPLEVLWADGPGEPYLAGAVMDRERVYTVDRKGEVTARAASTGSVLWTHSLNEDVTATPSLASGWLYMATLKGNLYALEGQSGTVMAKTDLSGAARAATLVAEGRVFQGTDAGTLHVLDSATLDPLWSFTTSTVSFANGTIQETDKTLKAAIRSPPAVHDGRVFFAAWNGRAYSMSLYGNENGHPETLHWIREVGDAVKAAPAVDRHHDHVIVPTKEGRLKAFHPTSGATVWQSETASFISGVAVDKKQVIARTSDHELFSLNATTGKKQWSREDPAGHLSAPVLAQDAIVQTTGNGTLALLSRTTGQTLTQPGDPTTKTRWTFDGAIHAAPAVTKNGIVVVDHSGTLSLLGWPSDLQSDLEALTVRTVDIPLGSELGLELGVRNHGPDPAPEIHVRIERDGVLHKEETLDGLDAGDAYTWEFRFASDPGEHELSIQFRSVGAKDPDPERARTTTRVVLRDAEQDAAAGNLPETGILPEEEPESGSGFTQGLTRGLTWAAIPGTIAGIAGGILLARRFSRRSSGTPTPGSART